MVLETFKTELVLLKEEKSILAALPPRDAQLQLIARQSETMRYFRTLKTFQNSFSPVNRLPAELLVLVFRYVISSVPDYLAIPWLKLTAVCRHWRTVALDTPGIWACIDLTKPWKIIHLCLERSKNTPLDLYTPSPADINQRQNTTVPRFDSSISLMSSHGHRVRSLRLSYLQNTDVEFLSYTRLFAMPSLESLEIMLPVPGGRKQHLPILGTRVLFNNLHSLSLQRVDLIPDSHVLAGLTVLRLNLWKKATATSTHSLFSVLDKCPELTELSITACGPFIPKGATTHPEATRLISLPKLRRLLLRDAPLTIAYTLAHLVFPNDTSTTLCAVVADIKFFVDSSLAFTSMLPRNGSRGIHLPGVKTLGIITTCQESKIYAHHFADPTSSVYSAWELSLQPAPKVELPRVPLVIALGEIPKYFASSPVDSVVISSCRLLSAHSDWRDALTCLPHLQRLEIHGHDAFDTMDTLFHVLRGCARHAPQALCPALHTLVIREIPFGPNAIKLLCTCFEARAKIGMRLARLELCCENARNAGLEFGDEGLERLRSLVDHFSYTPPTTKSKNTDS